MRFGDAVFSPRYYTMLGYEPYEFPQNYEAWRKLVHRRDIREAERATGHALEPADAALIHFGWERHYLDDGGTWWAANAPGLAADACAYLVDRGAGLVGSDTATCDTAVRDGMIVSDVGHQIYFLPNGIPIVEGGKMIGAIGCSGGTGSQDEVVSKAGLAIIK